MSQSKIIVTGGNGFLGKSVCKLLKQDRRYDVTPLAGKSKWDLTNQRYVDYMLHEFSPDIIVHLAARVGGIGANKENPGLFMYEKFVMVGTVCAYPKFTKVPFQEVDLWNGYPEETNAPYGIAKKALMELLIAYNKQYDFQCANLIPVNMYGPHDNFDPKISHVIPALILKFAKAIQNGHASVEIWGTGSASREFLYVDDCAKAILETVQTDTPPDPVNIGTGSEITIKDLVQKIGSLMKYQGDIYFNPKYPDGQPRRCLDTHLAKSLLHFEAAVDLDTGLQKTVEWFNKNKDQFVDYFDHIQ